MLILAVLIVFVLISGGLVFAQFNKSDKQSTTQQTSEENAGNTTSTANNDSTTEGQAPTSDDSTPTSTSSPSTRGTGTTKTSSGDTVKFTNNSSKSMWPASDNHPSHNIYPEFDAKNSIAPGGAYSFTFNKTGAWDYLDHIKPSCSGTITVQ